MLKRFWYEEDGQGMTEYVIIVALIAIAAIFAIKVYGAQLREAFYTISQALTGDEDATQADLSQHEADVDSAKMSDFSEDSLSGME